MKRIYEAPAYGPQGKCYWADTVEGDDWPALPSPRHSEVAIIGGGFTGLSAALHLAQDGVEVTVLEAGHAGYGASGRNGGFCCLGGSKGSSGYLRRRYGAEIETMMVAGRVWDVLLKPVAADLGAASERVRRGELSERLQSAAEHAVLETMTTQVSARSRQGHPLPSGCAPAAVERRPLLNAGRC